MREPYLTERRERDAVTFFVTGYRDHVSHMDKLPRNAPERARTHSSDARRKVLCFPPHTHSQLLLGSPMPGPSNKRRPRKSKGGRHRDCSEPTPPKPAPSPDVFSQTPSPSLSSFTADQSQPRGYPCDEDVDDDDGPHQTHTTTLPPLPYVHDPGNGPRVRQMLPFLSSFFAQPRSTSDPLCAEFADEAIAEMLCSALPEELALVRHLVLLQLHSARN